MKKILIVFIMLCEIISFISAKEKKSKNIKNKTINEDESSYVESIDVEIITREQITSMFSLAEQLNIDLKAAIENKEPSMAEELDYLISEEKQQLDNLIPNMKASSEWTGDDDKRLNLINLEYKKLSRKYKPAK